MGGCPPLLHLIYLLNKNRNKELFTNIQLQSIIVLDCIINYYNQHQCLVNADSKFIYVLNYNLSDLCFTLSYCNYSLLLRYGTLA